MALKTEPITLETSEGPREFEVTQFTCMRSVRMMTRLGKMLGPALEKLKGAAAGDQGDALAAIGDLLQTLEEVAVEKLILDLLEVVTIDGTPLRPQLDMLFAGKLASLFKLAAFVVQVNYSDFFGALGDLAKLGPKASALKT